jgi:hypothetical protein
MKEDGWDERIKHVHYAVGAPKTVVIDGAATAAAAAAAAEACAGHRLHAPHTVSTEIRQGHGASELRRMHAVADSQSPPRRCPQNRFSACSLPFM